METALFGEIDESWASWKDLFLSAVDQCIPTKSVKDTNSPSWIDSDLCHHIPKKYGALRKYRLNKSDDNKLKLRSLSQHVKYLVKRKHRLYLEKIEDVFPKNPKLFWSYQKAVLHHRAKPNSVITYNGREATTPAEKVDLSNSFFSSVFNPPNPVVNYDISALSVHQHRSVMQVTKLRIV